MVRIVGDKVILRSVDFSDIDTLLLWENSNNEPLYGIFKERYTRKNVKLFVMLQMQYTIEQTEQLRLMICSPEGERLGTIDLTEYDGRKAFVSILIVDLCNRRKGFGREALRLTIEYAKSLGMRSLYATILDENEASLQLFLGAGFTSLSGFLYRKDLRLAKP